MNREDIIRRLRALAAYETAVRDFLGMDIVICSVEGFRLIQELAGEAADALERDIEIPIYDQEEIYHNCTVQMLYSSYTGDYSVGWWKEEGGIDI